MRYLVWKGGRPATLEYVCILIPTWSSAMTCTRNVNGRLRRAVFKLYILAISNDLGKTWEEISLNRRVINTMDTVNYQYIHALGYEEFGKPSVRAKISTPILGNGIFMAEGTHWKESRSIIKPTFAAAEIGNMVMMARHVDWFLALLLRTRLLLISSQRWKSWYVPYLMFT